MFRTIRLLPLLLVVLAMPAAAQGLGPTPAHPGWGWQAAGNGRLGVGIQAMTEELRELFGAPTDVGVLVNRIEPGSAAEQAGIAVGDVITFVDGEPIADPRALVAAVVPRGGQTVTITVVRDRETVGLSATITGDTTGEPSGPQSAVPIPMDRDGHTYQFEIDGEENLGEVLDQFQELGFPFGTDRQELLARIEELERRLSAIEELIEQEHAAE